MSAKITTTIFGKLEFCILDSYILLKTESIIEEDCNAIAPDLADSSQSRNHR